MVTSSLIHLHFGLFFFFFFLRMVYYSMQHLKSHGQMRRRKQAKLYFSERRFKRHDGVIRL